MYYFCWKRPEKSFNKRTLVVYLLMFILISLLLLLCPRLRLHSGEAACLSTSLPSAMSSRRMSPLQSADKTIMSLWCDGTCFWVHILQQLVHGGANQSPFVWRTLSQVNLWFMLLFGEFIAQFIVFLSFLKPSDSSILVQNCLLNSWSGTKSSISNKILSLTWCLVYRKLSNCTHLCPETCHSGECPAPEKCSKKVTFFGELCRCLFLTL